MQEKIFFIGHKDQISFFRIQQNNLWNRPSHT